MEPPWAGWPGCERDGAVQKEGTVEILGLLSRVCLPGVHPEAGSRKPG